MTDALRDQRPHDDRQPRHADHVGLQPEHERREEAAPSQGRARSSSRARRATRRRTEHPEHAGLDAELGVGRLARLDLHVRARRRDPCVAETEAPRVVDDRADAVAQAREMLADRRLVGAVASFDAVGCSSRSAAARGSARRGEMRPRAEVVYSFTNANAMTSTATASTSGLPGAPHDREHDEQAETSASKAARVCVQRSAAKSSSATGGPIPPAQRDVEQRHHEEIAGRERRQEGRGQPAEDLVRRPRCRRSSAAGRTAGSSSRARADP